jgi:hypothetical protein
VVASLEHFILVWLDWLDREQYGVLFHNQAHLASAAIAPGTSCSREKFTERK